MNHNSKNQPQPAAWGAQKQVVKMRRRILAWFCKHKRNLPWRLTRDPYRIWISEIMLQQTRAAAVIPYYERFLKRFPDIGSLAAAREHDVLTAWAGLGYYSRARNLRLAAKKIQERGDFPRDYDSLLMLPGVGDYTAAAIASIAFDLPHPVLDGNVIRVLSRLTGERGNVSSIPVRKRLRETAGQLLDGKQSGEFNQALMELGATLCSPRDPECDRCPWGQNCVAHQSGEQNSLPVKTVKPASHRVVKRLLVVEKTGKILLWQRPNDDRRLAGFWELPEFEQLPEAQLSMRAGRFRHTIVNTAFQFEVYRATAPIVPESLRWQSKKTLGSIPLSTTARKALACLSESDR